MRTTLRQLGILLFIGIAVFSPFFEVFEEGRDLEHGFDFVQLLLQAMTLAALGVLLTLLFSLILHWLRFCRIFQEPVGAVLRCAVGVEPAPPRTRLLLSILRI